MSYLPYLWLLAYCGAEHILFCVFVCLSSSGILGTQGSPPDIIELVTLTSDVSRPNRADVKITLAEVPSCFRILLAVLSVTQIYYFTSYYI
jgi:hypothetical protein